MIAGCISVAGAIFYAVFGTGVEQPWNNLTNVQGQAATPILAIDSEDNDSQRRDDECLDDGIKLA